MNHSTEKRSFFLSSSVSFVFIFLRTAKLFVSCRCMVNFFFVLTLEDQLCYPSVFQRRQSLSLLNLILLGEETAQVVLVFSYCGLVLDSRN